MANLHITNGDAVLYLLKKAGFVGTQIAWRDSLHDGPVRAGLSLHEMSHARAKYLAEREYASAIKLFHDFELRDAPIAQAASFDEIVLWFEHDLYDQLQLVQILVILKALALQAGQVSLVASDIYLGSLTVEELSALYPRRRSITGAIYLAAERVWNAFTASTPEALVEHTQIDPLGLMFLRPAMRRLCEEYPAPHDGLSRSQRNVLLALAPGGVTDDAELLRRVQGREEAPFLVDAAFSAMLADLMRGPQPLIDDADGNRTLSARGRRILAGDEDWLAEGGVDRWIGGVHIAQGSPWRFDAERGVFAQ